MEPSFYLGVYFLVLARAREEDPEQEVTQDITWEASSALAWLTVLWLVLSFCARAPPTHNPKFTLVADGEGEKAFGRFSPSPSPTKVL